MITCEVCVEGLQGALAAEAGGAHRIELCAGLVEGGTTPSPGTLALARSRVDIDIMVLVRPRGGDFLYEPDELDTLLADVGAAREVGVTGIATGALTASGEVDGEAMARVMETAGPLSVTFHRAFDMVRDPLQALETLVDLGVDRILTSGQERSVPEGLSLIRTLVEEAGDRISIMPGGGVTEENVAEILQETGAREVHFTAFRRDESPMAFRNPRPFMGATDIPGEYERLAIDPDLVRRTVGAVAKPPGTRR